jgi:hypothetical protein
MLPRFVGFEQQLQGKLAAKVWPVGAEGEFERACRGMPRRQEVKVFRDRKQGLAAIGWKVGSQMVLLRADRSGEEIEGCHG